jgi:hypothetical protein
MFAKDAQEKKVDFTYFHLKERQFGHNLETK